MSEPDYHDSSSSSLVEFKERQRILLEEKQRILDEYRVVLQRREIEWLEHHIS